MNKSDNSHSKARGDQHRAVFSEIRVGFVGEENCGDWALDENL
jgi:hypothetical protein